jgi:hypothetical protein
MGRPATGGMVPWLIMLILSTPQTSAPLQLDQLVDYNKRAYNAVRRTSNVYML